MIVIRNYCEVWNIFLPFFFVAVLSCRALKRPCWCWQTRKKINVSAYRCCCSLSTKREKKKIFYYFLANNRVVPRWGFCKFPLTHPTFIVCVSIRSQSSTQHNFVVSFYNVTRRRKNRKVYKAREMQIRLVTGEICAIQQISRLRRLPWKRAWNYSW